MNFIQQFVIPIVGRSRKIKLATYVIIKMWVEIE